MIRYIQTAPTASDCTAPYDVLLDREYTVAEFIKAVLKQNPREWGKFRIFNKECLFGHPSCEYRDGELTEFMPDDILKLKIVKVEADGGWSLMNYLIWLEEEK